MEDLDICSLGLYSPGDADDEAYNMRLTEAASLAYDGLAFDDFEGC